jgi:hypothetical protein
MVHMMVNLPIDISENGFIITLVALLWCPVVTHEQVHLTEHPESFTYAILQGREGIINVIDVMDIFVVALNNRIFI